MNVPTAIIDFSRNHDYAWYLDIWNEFTADIDYDAVSGTIKKEICSKKYDNEDLLIEEDYYDVEADIVWYCWNADTDPFNSKYLILKQSLNHLVAIVGDAISHSGNEEKKLIVINKTDQILREKVAEMTIKKPNSYREIINQFLNVYRNDISSKYGNIYWINNINDPIKDSILKNQYIPNHDLKKTKQLRKSFFESMLELYDEEHNPIIAREFFNLKERYTDILYQIYRGNYSSQDLSINFLWKMESVYYIINRIAQTKPGLTLTEIIKHGVIQANSKKLNYSACRKGASSFAKKNSNLKSIIDRFFSNELNR